MGWQRLPHPSPASTGELKEAPTMIGARNDADDAPLSAGVASRRALQGDNPGVTRSGQLLPQSLDDGIPLGDVHRQRLDVLDERADKSAQFGHLGAAHGPQLGFECTDVPLEGPGGGPPVTRFGGTSARTSTARFAVARLTPASRARLVTASAPWVRSGRPSSSRAIAARSAASLFAPSVLMLRPLSEVR